MQINFISQPSEQLGILLDVALDSVTSPTEIIFVSAFASRQAVLRLKSKLHSIKSAEAGVCVRIVVGVDLGGTSKEVLSELGTWPVEVFVFKNRKGGVTFHPKLYLIEGRETADLFLGSNNLTEGGLYKNYEGAVRVSYDLPADVVNLQTAKDQLSKFLNPAAPVGRRLDSDYLKLLLSRSDIPSEAEARKSFKRSVKEAGDPSGEEAFGFEETPGPPKLPIEVQEVVMAAVRQQLDELDQAKKKAQKEYKAKEKLARDTAAKGGKKVPMPAPITEPDIRAFTPLAQITPESFYLELTTTSSATGRIPGEQRIPLEAINAAQDFWGWPDNYAESINPRKGSDSGGEDRKYLSWKPMWRVRSLSDSTKDVEKPIRMYLYVNSSDFRFYSGDLANWASAGDMVRITQCEGLPYHYECELAVAGTPEHSEWKALCAATSARSTRVFGFS